MIAAPAESNRGDGNWATTPIEINHGDGNLMGSQLRVVNTNGSSDVSDIVDLYTDNGRSYSV